MDKCFKRAVAFFLIPLTAFSVIIGSYTTAYSASVVVPAVSYGLGEVWWTLFASMGVTVALSTTDAVKEFGQEVSNTFDLWVKDNNFDEIDKQALKEEIANLPSKIKDGAMNVSAKLWDALKTFRTSFINDYNYFNPAIDNVSMLNALTAKGCNVDADFPAKLTAWRLKNPELVHYALFVATSGSTWHLVFMGKYANYIGRKGSYWALNGVNTDFVIPNCTAYHSTKSCLPGTWSSTSNKLLCSGYYGYDELISTDLPIDAPLSRLHIFDKDYAYDLCPVTQPYLNGYDIITRGRTWSDADGLGGDLVLNIPTDLVGKDVITSGVTWQELLEKIGAIPVDAVGEVVIPWDDAIEKPETIPDALDRVRPRVIIS